MLSEAVETKPDTRRSGKEIIQRLIDNVKGQLQLHPVRVFVLAVIAGGLICYGAALGVRLSVGLNSPGVEHFMVSFGFLAGFTVVALSGSLLNSVVNVEYSVFLLHNVNSAYDKESLLRLALFWVVVNVGNLIGSLGTAGLLVYVNVFNQDDEERLNDILTDKLKDAHDGVPGLCVVFVSAMLANWIVGHCVINAASSRTTAGKAVGIFYCVFMFAVLGLQHGAASNGQIFLGLMSGVDAASWGRSMWGNVIPAIFGNAVGGMVFVAWPFWYSTYFTKTPKNSWKPKSDQESKTNDRKNNRPAESSLPV